jgi:hypothetical protein
MPHIKVTSQPPQLIGLRLRATRHAWRTQQKSGVACRLRFLFISFTPLTI